MKLLFYIVIVIHGLIHLLGFVKAFHLADVSQLTHEISKPAGILWLMCAVVFLLSFCLLLTHNQYWWIVGIAAILLSQVLIFQSWSDAKFGSIANIIILVPVLVAFLNSLPSSYINMYKTEVQKGLARHPAASLSRSEDIKHLPLPVQKYLQYAGAVGKPRIQNFRAVFNGSMKQDPEGTWMDVFSQQYNFYDLPTWLFYIESSMFGIPFDGFHKFVGGQATMQIKVAALVQVVNAEGEKMTRGETVTLFNDMCFMAPATLIDKSIEWETIDSLTVKARFTFNANTITAILYFDREGKLINFISNDRYLSSDGKTYTSYPWSTPVKEYREINGRKIPSCAVAVWHTPQGEYTYAKFNLVEIEYNCGECKY